MNLFLLRHGIAFDPGEGGLSKHASDVERPLSPEGRIKLRHAVAAMQDMELEFAEIISSPLLRASQTAEIVAESLKPPKKICFSDHLAPDGNPKLLIDQIHEGYSEGEDVLLVGHEPYLTQLISLLISGSTTAAVSLKKGGLARLRVERELCFGRCAELVSLLTPAQMRLMSKR